MRQDYIPPAYISLSDDDRIRAGFDAKRATRMAQYGLPRNFAVIGAIKPDKAEADRIADVLEKAIAEIENASEQKDRHFLPSYAAELLSVYQLNAWPIPKSLVRIFMVLVDVDGHMSASVRYIEKKAIEKSTALDLAREIIGDQPRHIPLFQLAAEICKRARDESFSEDGSAPPGLAFRDFYISDLTLGKMKEDLKSIGWQDIEKPRKPRSRGRSNNSADSPAEIRPAADERKRPTVATSLDPGLSRLPRGSN